MNIFKTIILILALYANAAHSSEAGRGYLDSAIYSRSNHALTVYGWVASEKQNIFVTNIMVDVDGAQIYQGRLQRSERDDVAAITGRQDWLASGFEVGIQLPDSIEGGVHSVHARARFSNGDEKRNTIIGPKPARARINPFNMGIVEQLQKGVIAPKPAALNGASRNNSAWCVFP